MRKKSLYILLAVLVLTISILAVPAIADAGNFSGDSDYGGGSSDWGSSDYDYDYDSDYDYDDGYYYDDSDSDSGGSGGIITFTVAAIIVVAVIIAVFAKKGGGATLDEGAELTSDLEPISTLMEKDPNFSEAGMEEKIANLYVQMQHAWQDKKFESMRPHMTDALYNQFERQLGEMVRANCTNYIERISVLDVQLTGWREDEVNDAIVAVLNTRIVDYTVNDKTDELVSGSKSAEKFMCYEWTLIRSKGMTTPAASGDGSKGTVSIHCPSCGAPVEINQSAKCPYCDNVISSRDYDWSISAIKGISQRTAD